ncbi:MAG TPA: DUF2269 family protein [Alphaproteobacteria bacterium]|nr:DUF2269 family protein [Alphaproteobacteria bacterium]
MQIQLRRMLADALVAGNALPQRYHKLFRIWFWLGWPAFTSLIIIFFLMVMKPV